MQAGIATILSGVFYAIYGFSDAAVAKVNDYISAGLIPREIPEFDPYMEVLFLIISIPPAIGCILSVIPTWKYCLDDKEHARILDELNKRRSALEE
jgi:Na+/melibiose symporter-like transporter